MDSNIFNSMEIDAIGEILNISLGSSATAVSNLLDHRVDITTPQVSVVTVEDFTLGELEPAVGVEIKYVSGLEGSNIMLLKRNDVKVIVDILMGSETPDEEFELNELTISAVCEVMNQMMGAASTALSDFLDKLVNISTPQSFELDDFETFKKEHFPVSTGPVVVVRFTLSIEDALKSEFINVMSVKLARELIAGFGLGTGEVAEPEPAPAPAADSGGKMSQEEIERPMGNMGGAPAQMPPAAQGMPPMPPYGYPYPPQQPPADGQMPPYGYPPYYPPYPPYYAPPEPPKAPEPKEPKVIHTKQAPLPSLDGTELGEDQAQNLELIMSVPLEVSVEIGRTHRKVQDILSFSKGSLVVLDKLAGDQVDLFVNGQCIAKGDVVIIDDNFGIRITEILKRPGLEDLARS